MPIRFTRALKGALAATAALGLAALLLPAVTHSKHAPRKVVTGPRARPSRVKKAPAPPAPPPQKHAFHPPPAEVVVMAAYGSAPGELGKKTRSEGAPEAPMSFAVDAGSRVHVLDQVNARIQVFSPGGGSPRVIDLPADTFQDIAIDARGNDVAMDRLATKTLAFLDDRGEIDHTVPLEGPGVPEGGGVTGMFTRPDGVWVEVEHGALVRIASANGEPDTDRPTVPGRFALDGRTAVHASITSPSSFEVLAEPLAKGGFGFTASFAMPLSILGLHDLELDERGNTYVVANTILESDRAPFDVLEERETVVVLDERGAEVGRVEIAPPEGPEEQFRPIRVGADGSIYQLVAGANAATVERFVR